MCLTKLCGNPLVLQYRVGQLALCLVLPRPDRAQRVLEIRQFGDGHGMPGRILSALRGSGRRQHPADLLGDAPGHPVRSEKRHHQECDTDQRQRHHRPMDAGFEFGEGHAHGHPPLPARHLHQAGRHALAVQRDGLEHPLPPCPHLRHHRGGHLAPDETRRISRVRHRLAPCVDHRRSPTRRRSLRRHEPAQGIGQERHAQAVDHVAITQHR